MNHLHHYSLNNIVPKRAGNAGPVRTEELREIIQDGCEVLRFARDDGKNL